MKNYKTYYNIENYLLLHERYHGEEISLFSKNIIFVVFYNMLKGT